MLPLSCSTGSGIIGTHKPVATAFISGMGPYVFMDLDMLYCHFTTFVLSSSCASVLLMCVLSYDCMLPSHL